VATDLVIAVGVADAVAMRLQKTIPVLVTPPLGRLFGGTHEALAWDILRPITRSACLKMCWAR
jgi:hypothetical protein